MCEQYRTKGKACFSSLTAHSCQHYNMCNNKSAVPEFPIFTMIVSLYYSSISDTYSFMFATQYMIVTPSPKANEKNEMTRYLYTCELFFGTNIIIARILVSFYFMKSSQSCISNSLFPHHIFCTS